MIIVNLIDKQQLLSDDDAGGSTSFGGSFGGGVAWKARLFLFLGFALMAGGLAGSVVRGSLAIQFEKADGSVSRIDRSCDQVHSTTMDTVRSGLVGRSERATERMHYAEVCCALLLLSLAKLAFGSASILWMAQNTESEYEYNLRI